MSQRKSTKRKAELVMRLLRGEIIEEVSRLENITIAELSEWRNQFIQKGTDGLKKDPEKSEISRYERIIGRQQMELELIKKKNELMAKFQEK